MSYNTLEIAYGLGGNMDKLGSLTATDSLYKPQTLIKTGFPSYFFVNFRATFCSYL